MKNENIVNAEVNGQRRLTADPDTDKTRRHKTTGLAALILLLAFGKESQISEARKFRYSTREYHNNNEVIRELSDLWPEYRKNIISFQKIQDRCEVAICNTNKIKQFHDETKSTEIIEKCNPSTDVYKLATRIIKYKNNF